MKILFWVSVLLLSCNSSKIQYVDMGIDSNSTVEKDSHDVAKTDVKIDASDVTIKDVLDVTAEDVLDVNIDVGDVCFHTETPCGPCGFDSICVRNEKSECDGETLCGQECLTDNDCGTQDAVCFFGHCSTPDEAFIGKGTFRMGSPEEEVGRTSLEVMHNVTFTHDLFVHRFPVTQGDFKKLMGVNPSIFSSCGDNCAVDSVTFYEAVAYANKKSIKAGLTACYDVSDCVGDIGTSFTCESTFLEKFADYDLNCNGFRLPTEAEWEYVARAGSTTSFFTGESKKRHGCDVPILNDYVWYCGTCESAYKGEKPSADCSIGGARPHLPSACRTTELGQKKPNVWGVSEMIGGVKALIWDQKGPYAEGPQIDPKGPTRYNGKISIRGGGFCGHRDRLRSADRKFTSVSIRNSVFGIRLVRNSDSAIKSN